MSRKDMNSNKRPFEIFEMDAKNLDIVLVDKDGCQTNRKALYVLTDIQSRKITGFGFAPEPPDEAEEEED